MDLNKQQTLTLKKWISFSTLGWVLGVITVVVLALVLESLNLGFSSQVVVGIGMGGGVGIMQWVALRKFSNITKTWIFASLTGFGLSYLLADIVFYLYDLKPESILPFATGLGALISGWMQASLVLKKITERYALWTAYNFTAWIIAHTVTMGLFYLSSKFNEGLPSYVSIFIAFLFLVIGGPVLGYITSMGILPLVNQPLKNNDQPFS